jgi:hypothetical protein
MGRATSTWVQEWSLTFSKSLLLAHKWFEGDESAGNQTSAEHTTAFTMRVPRFT